MIDTKDDSPRPEQSRPVTPPTMQKRRFRIEKLEVRITPRKHLNTKDCVYLSSTESGVSVF